MTRRCRLQLSHARHRSDDGNDITRQGLQSLSRTSTLLPRRHGICRICLAASLPASTSCSQEACMLSHFCVVIFTLCLMSEASHSARIQQACATGRCVKLSKHARSTGRIVVVTVTLWIFQSHWPDVCKGYECGASYVRHWHDLLGVIRVQYFVVNRSWVLISTPPSSFNYFLSEPLCGKSHTLEREPLSFFNLFLSVLVFFCLPSCKHLTELFYFLIIEKEYFAP